MPHTDVKQTYLVQLTAEEYRLVTLALAGKLKDSEDLRAAVCLNTQLCSQRVKSLKNQHEVAFEAMRLAQLLENPSVPPTETK